MEAPADTTWKGFSLSERRPPRGESGAVTLPTDGRKPIIVSDVEQGNDWLPEFRRVKRSWGEAMAEALIEYGMERARIGVAGLSRGRVVHGRAYAGVVNHTSYAEVLRR